MPPPDSGVPVASVPLETWGLLFNGLLSVLLVMASAVYSGSEPVLFSLTRVQLQNDRKSANPLRRLVARLMEDPKRTLMVILLANTAVNVALYANTYVLFEHLEAYLPIPSDVLAGVLSVLVVSILGEAIPKTLGVHLAPRLAPYVAAVVHVTGYALGPLSRLLDVFFTAPLARLLLGERAGEARAMTTTELKALLEMSRRRGAMNPVEDAFLREVIDLGHLRVHDVMVPRIEMHTYDVNGSTEGLIELLRRVRRKKIPVYDGAVDNLVGLIYAKMVYFNPNERLRNLVQPVRFVPELATCEQLLVHFRSTRSQLAIAVDEYGGVAGLVTLEDVLEVIVGDLPAPHEEVEAPEIVQLADDEFDISGRLGIHYWAEAFNMPRLPDRVATVSGLVVARLGRPARVGDRVRLGNLELTVTRVQHWRIERLRVRLLSNGEDGAAEAREGRST